MNCTSQRNLSRHQGFSLLEMLLVIAVIGIISAIGIPALSSMNGMAGDATAKRNAQNLASVFASAIASGVEWNVPQGTKAGAIAAVQAGTTSPAGENFSVEGLSADAVNAAKPFLRYEDSKLVYIKAGGQSDR